MTDQLLKPSELKRLLELERNGNYEFKHFVNKNYFHLNALFQDHTTREEVAAKLVLNPLEGELYHWPKFCQENLSPLLGMVTIEDTWHIFISPHVGETLKKHITDCHFFRHPKSFERKIFYATGILRGIEYLHKNHFCLLTLCAEHIYICKRTDKAVIANFSGTTSTDELCNFKVSPSDVLVPPELKKTDNMNLVKGCAVDIWCCGIMCLQIFTQFYLPNKNSNVLEDFTIDLVTNINSYSRIFEDVFASLKSFLEMLLNTNVSQRASATEALSSHFLNRPLDRLDKSARRYWENIEKALSRRELSKNNKMVSNSKLTLENINQPINACKRVIKSTKSIRKRSNFSSRKCFSFRYQTDYKSPLTENLNGAKSCPSFNFPESTPKKDKNKINFSLKNGNSNCLSGKKIPINILSNTNQKFKKDLEVSKKPFLKREKNNSIGTLIEIRTSEPEKREDFFDISKIDSSSRGSINFCEYLQRLDSDPTDAKNVSMFEDSKTLSKLKIRANGGCLHNVWRTAQNKRPAKFSGADHVESAALNPLTLIVSDCPRNRDNKATKRNNKSKKNVTSMVLEPVVSQNESIDFPLEKSLFPKNKKKRKNVWAELFCLRRTFEM